MNEQICGICRDWQLGGYCEKCEEIIMTPVQFEQAMKAIEENHKYDIEGKLFNMVELMADTLYELGYDKGVDVYNGTEK